LYDEYMTRVFVSDTDSTERAALRLLILDLRMEIVGEAADWATTLAQAPVSRAEMLLIDWDLLPNSPTAALDELRKACPAALLIVLISHLDAREQAALSAGADAFISKGELPERVAERLRTVAASVSPADANWLNVRIEDRRNKAVPSTSAKLEQLFQIKNLEHQIMDKNEFEGRWKIIRDQSKVWWNLITDSDLDQVEKADVKFFEYVTILQLKYGYDRQVAKDEVAKRVAEFDAKLESIIATRP
jgi:DNA-binding NarL/FixJ family response regulator